jgi:hypothetical protein
MEYWSFGVMGENRIAKYHPYLRAHRDMIIFLEKVIGQNQFRRCANHYYYPYMTGNAFSINQYSNTPVILGNLEHFRHFRHFSGLSGDCTFNTGAPL